MRFIVTGGAGFIGSNIVKLLVQKKYDVTVIDNLHTGNKKNLESVYDKIDFYEVDIRNKKDLEEIIPDCDGIFHQAALTVVPESFVTVIPSASKQLPSPNAVEWLQFAEPCDSAATHAPISFPVAAGTIRSVVDSLTLIPATHLIPNSCPLPSASNKTDCELSTM